ncbi:activator of basal transcription 1-like [Brachionus plicatilis]|uniref:Activator of basal transcription 1 n=1 Tax=Brachionus plicatilis TaxID=10195 RepID=A0A3M7QQJ7_BRAPC|nr:activator of basal transcription 1-like [Brachionus plicatilis]
MEELKKKETNSLEEASNESEEQPEKIEPKNKKIKTTNESEDENEVNSKGKKNTAGVLYLSRIPNRMNVKIIREYFSNFGQVERIYLEPMEQKRKNQPRAFAEGWIEFKQRKIAKKVSKMLNNMQVGGKRRNPWFHELWNIKYLKNFKWTHLNEKLAYEQESRKQRLRQEVALAKKEANFYIQNVEKNEKRKRFERKQNKDETESKNDQISSKDEPLPKTSQNDDDEAFKPKNKHPVFERKVKVVGNDSFLKQIFS